VKKFVEQIYMHRDKEANWDIEARAEKEGFGNSSNIVYLGYEVGMEVEVREDLKHKVLKINGIDVSDKNITI
jgi:virulence-associated protein VapD